jgi:hypothetical protein
MENTDLLTEGWSEFWVSRRIEKKKSKKWGEIREIRAT